jgi:BMFP domain-containing protein YqiC
VTNPTLHSPISQIDFPLEHAEAQRQTLMRLYERKATLEALIESLEAYARCRASAQVMSFPLRGN